MKIRVSVVRFRPRPPVFKRPSARFGFWGVSVSTILVRATERTKLKYWPLVVLVGLLGAWSVFMTKELGVGFVLFAWALCGGILAVLAVVKWLEKIGVGGLILGIAAAALGSYFFISFLMSKSVDATPASQSAPSDNPWDNARR
ncbi:MAG: hypothetical protein U1E71_12645 [Ramlibacter sp.]